MTQNFSQIKYLQIIHIPFARNGDGDVIVDEVWANELKAQTKCIGPIRIVAPEITDPATLSTWGPTTTKITKDSGLTFVGIPPISSRKDYINLPKIWKILRKEVLRADIVHTSNPFPPYLVFSSAHNLALKHGKKTIFVICEDFYDMCSWEWVRSSETARKRWYRQRQLDKIEKKVVHMAKTASLTLLCSPAVVERYRCHVKNSIVIRHTTHTENDVISERDINEKCHRMMKGCPIIISTVARHQLLKGHDFLIYVLAELKKRKIPVEMKIYGFGAMTNSLKQLVNKLDVCDCLSFPGPLSPGKPLYQAIANSHIFAMTDRTTGFGRVFFDALAGGSPVVAFHTSASIHTIRHGIDGIVVPQDNIIDFAWALEMLHCDRPLLVKMAQAARTRALSETQTRWLQFREERIRELFSND